MPQGSHWASDSLFGIRFRPGEGHICSTCAIAALALLASALQEVRSPRPDECRIRGLAIARSDSQPLPGTEIRLSQLASGELSATVFADADGRYRIDGVEAGTYALSAARPGFASVVIEPVVLKPGEMLEIDLSLPLEEIEGSVEVLSREGAGAAAARSVDPQQLDLAPIRGDDFRQALPLLPGLLRGSDGRLVFKGGRSAQTALIVNNANDVTDPATGELGFILPSDAIETVSFLANPFSPEYGRFSTGVTNLVTRQGDNRWKWRIHNFLPRPKRRDGSIMGVSNFAPRIGASGPLIEDRLFIAQTLQYRHVVTNVPSLPELESDTFLESLASFTQLDAVLSDRHTLSGIVSFYPRKLDYVNLNTFNPQEATPNFRQRGYNLGLFERFSISSNALLESILSFKRYSIDVFGQGFDEMELTTEGRRGHFFNSQRRRSNTWQWIERFSLLRKGWGGEHLLKFGFDLERSSYHSDTSSRAINVLRSDSTLSRRIEFFGPGQQRRSSTELAIYAQDRFRVNDRLQLEFGARLDRDGLFERFNLAPRMGFAIAMLPQGRGILKGGAGLFFDRVPLIAGSFESFETRRVQRFASDGQTPLGPTQVFRPQSARDLRTPFGFAWNVEYGQRLGERWRLRTSFLRRNGHRELLVDAVEGPENLLRLDSRGRSRYWELEMTAQFAPREGDEATLTYVRSRSRRDLNQLTQLLGDFHEPVIRTNQFSLDDADAPHRFILQGRFGLGWQLSLHAIAEIRSGFPFSAVDQNQDYVGVRNRAGRLPTVGTLDLQLNRPFRWRRWAGRIGLRFFNISNRFNARDVQNNIDSLDFGLFSNQIRRQLGFNIQITP